MQHRPEARGRSEVVHGNVVVGEVQPDETQKVQVLDLLNVVEREVEATEISENFF